MDLVIVISIGIIFSLVTTYVTYLISKKEFFAEAIRAYRELAVREVGEVKDKRSLRRIRKIRSELKRVRRRLTTLFIIGVVLFTSMYMLCSSLIYYLYPGVTGFKKIPFAIPLFSQKINDEYYTHVIVIGFLAFMTPSYLFARIIKFR